jgi:hypothetical protein
MVVTLGDGHLRYAIITSVITHIERGHTQASVWALAAPVPTTERWVIPKGHPSICVITEVIIAYRLVMPTLVGTLKLGFRD